VRQKKVDSYEGVNKPGDRSCKTRFVRRHANFKAVEMKSKTYFYDLADI